jgi:hypothetical protein
VPRPGFEGVNRKLGDAAASDGVIQCDGELGLSIQYVLDDRFVREDQMGGQSVTAVGHLVVDIDNCSTCRALEPRGTEHTRGYECKIVVDNAHV